MQLQFFSLARHALAAGAAFLALSATAGDAGAFAQKSILSGNVPGHERITWRGGQLVGGAFDPAASTGDFDQKILNEMHLADTYDTRNLKLWSVIMGQRFADLGGYRVPTKCFDATAQDSDAVQYVHALRRKCDVGEKGLRAAHAGTVKWIKTYYDKAVGTPEDQLSIFKDGGATVVQYRAQTSGFLLGLAAHALQDSFSDEHTKRSADGKYILNINTYLGTDGATAHAKDGHPRSKFKLGVTPVLAHSHGDYAYDGKGHGVHNFKPSSRWGAEATADLIRAFQAARANPGQKDALFKQYVEDKWLQLRPEPAALAPVKVTVKCGAPTAEYPSGVPDDNEWRKMEHQRKLCLAKDGSETLMDGVYPKFCHSGKKGCTVGALDKVAHALAAAGKAVKSAVSKIGSTLSRLGQTAGDTLRHGGHKKSTCLRESRDYGDSKGDHFVRGAQETGAHFWSELGSTLEGLTLDERKKSVDVQWASVKTSILGEIPGASGRECHRVRDWFTLGKSKNAGQNDCVAHFNARVSGVGGLLDKLYETNLKKGLK